MQKKRKYAQGTSVPVAKTKGEIDKMLREWGCDRIVWEDDFRAGVVTLRFVWTFLDRPFAARLQVNLPTEADVRESRAARDGRSGKVNETKVARIMDRAGREEMRLLLLWLKAAFNATEAGILDPRVVFLPFFENDRGETVADLVIPKLSAGQFTRLLNG